MSGWVKLHRTLQKWGWKRSPNHVAVFIDLLLEANHEDGEHMGVSIPRGSLTTSIKAISQRSGVTQKSVRTILNHLKSTNEVAIKTTTKFTMISIVKWGDYQLSGKEMGKPLANEGQTTGKPLATNKNSRTKENKKSSGGIAEEILEEMNAICFKSFKSTAANLGIIEKRIAEGYERSDFTLVIQDRYRDWKDNPKMHSYIRPGTIFNGTFDSYLQAAKASLKPKFDPLEAFARKHLGDSVHIDSEKDSK
jgi:uncharacterized phage protein (TIGR02220 family)